MSDPHGPSDQLAAEMLQERPDRPGNLKDALAEVDRLRVEVERERMQRNYIGMVAQRDIARLRDLFARLEWSGQAIPGERIGTQPRCPVCRVTNPPHDRGCWLAAALHPEREKAP